MSKKTTRQAPSGYRRWDGPDIFHEHKHGPSLVQAIFRVMRFIPVTATPTRVVIYARSATDDTGQGITLAYQVELCRQWAMARDCAIVGEFSEVISGHAVDMPALNKALKRAHSQKAALLCTSPDRLARRLDLFLKRVNDCKQRGIPIVYVNLS
jgi:predicted site-specific integrase-resolvase